MRRSVFNGMTLIITKTDPPDNLEPMTTETSSRQPFLVELAKLIDEVCQRGETVNDIAVRAGLSRDLVSRLRNRTYRSAPSLANIEAVCNAIGYRLSLQPNSVVVVDEAGSSNSRS
ncbi:MAG: hypothetical protein NTY15_09945 [Planctomycetota bacterium]|nr:hypothetical protein [Planctomycetota bacterium]